MESISSPSTLEILPDEILLEVCKYLLCSDILYSFTGLNDRLTRMIAQYRHQITFYKAAISKFDYLCTQILPHIGWQVRSLHIDSCYSILQDRLFLEYFREKMSMTFPNLQRISLMSWSDDRLGSLLNSLHNMNELVEIQLYSIFLIVSQQQADFARLLFQANNHRLTTVLMDDLSTTLRFHKDDRYLNVLRLRLILESMADLAALLTTIPNVQFLDVLVNERDLIKLKEIVFFNSPLLHLTDFSLRSVVCAWHISELTALITLLPNVLRLSLALYTEDPRLIRGDMVLPLLPSTVEQFNYVVFTTYAVNTYETAVASWPPSHPIACFVEDHFLFLHTKPWYFSHLNIPTAIGKSVSLATIRDNGYEKCVRRVWLFINKNLSWNKSLLLLSQCRRAREVVICMMEDSDALKEEQPAISRIAELSYVGHIYFQGKVLPTVNYCSIILHALPNLFRLDLSFDCLLRLVEDPSICSLLSQRIRSLVITVDDVNSTVCNINEGDLSMIASIFSRVNGIYFNINHLTCSQNKVSSKDSAVLEKELISPLSSESFLLCLLKTFQEHSLLGLCIDGHFIDEIQTNAEQWLRKNTILADQRFAADFDRGLNRLFISM